MQPNFVSLGRAFVKLRKLRLAINPRIQVQLPSNIIHKLYQNSDKKNKSDNIEGYKHA